MYRKPCQVSAVKSKCMYQVFAVKSTFIYLGAAYVPSLFIMIIGSLILDCSWLWLQQTAIYNLRELSEGNILNLRIE